MKKKILSKTLFLITLIFLLGGCTKKAKKTIVVHQPHPTPLKNSSDESTHCEKTCIPYKPFFKTASKKTHLLPLTVKHAIKDKIAAQTASEAPRTVHPRKTAQPAAHSLSDLEINLTHLFTTLENLHVKLIQDEERDEHEKNILTTRIEKLILHVDNIRHYLDNGAPIDEGMFGATRKSAYKIYQRTATRKVATLKAKVEELVREIS